MQWVTISTEQFWGIVTSTFLIYIGLMLIVRLHGLRSFSKMSGHDFAITIAIGSILATLVLQDEPSVLQGLLAISMLLLYQYLFSYWRLKRDNTYIENCPIMLMNGEEILYDNLNKAKITKGDLIAKLREANVLSLGDVQYVVLEQTGDVSVLHGNKRPDKILMEGVRSF